MMRQQHRSTACAFSIAGGPLKSLACAFTLHAGLCVQPRDAQEVCGV